MSGSQDTAAQLKQLQNDHATGCLTVTSSDGLVAQIYLLFGRLFHAAGPTSEGETALNEALSWSDVSLSFDPKAHLPTKSTISQGTSGPAVEVHLLRRQPTPSADAIAPLDSDRRLTLLSCAPMAGGCLAALVPLALIGVGALVNAKDVDGWLITAGIAFLLIMGLSMAGYYRFRALFFRDAVTIPGGLPPDQIPRVVDASAGVITGQPDFAVKTQTRSTIGKLGKCWVEFYPGGIQISKGPDHPEPRWQFAYSDILQAEVADITSTGRMGTTHRYSVRMVTSKPRMGFLFGGSLFQNSKTQALAGKLREHKVTLLNEEFSF